MNLLIDSNILLRSMEVTHPMHGTTITALTTLRVRGDVVVIVPQNVYEFWAVSTRPVKANGRGMTSMETANELVFVESAYNLIHDTPAVYSTWKHLVLAHNVSGKPAHDARLVAAMLVHGITHILTFNGADFARYPFITVIDPRTV